MQIYKLGMLDRYQSWFSKKFT